MVFFKKSFQKRIERANRLFHIIVKKLEQTMTEIDVKVENNNRKQQKLSDENRELEIMKEKTSFQIKEVSKLLS
jgi:hypothetical protein|nr:MAG TPA: hypothetical protein [Caudoviricetes sp.]